MSEYYIDRKGQGKRIDFEPTALNRRERFGLWFLRRFTKRLTVVQVELTKFRGPKPIGRDDAIEIWRDIMKKWTPTRADDVFVLALSVDADTGEIE